MQRVQRPDHTPFFIGIAAMFGAGVALIIVSHFMDPPSKFPWAESVRDLGMVLAPIAIISGAYDFLMRQGFYGHMHDLSRGFSFLTIVFPRERTKTLEEIIGGTESTLVMAGITPLLEFAYTSKGPWLIEKFRKLQSVKIACLASGSQFVQTRKVQAGSVDIEHEISIHNTLMARLKSQVPSSILTIVEFDLPPAEFFYIADDRVLLTTWYPYRKGEESPCIYIDNVQNSMATRDFMKYFYESFDQLSQPAVVQPKSE